MTRKEQAQQTKHKLLEIATKLIQKNGYDNVKLTDICKEAGVSIGAFYHHFRNKSDIVVELYRECDEVFENEVYPAFMHRNDIEAVYDYLGFQMEYGEQFGVDMVVQIYKAQITDGAEFFLSMDRGLPKGLIHILEHLQQENVISSEKSAEEIASELLILSRGILYNWCQCHGNYDLKQKNRTIISNYMSSYKKA